jgi:hypothetical protein
MSRLIIINSFVFLLYFYSIEPLSKLLAIVLLLPVAAVVLSLLLVEEEWEEEQISSRQAFDQKILSSIQLWTLIPLIWFFSLSMPS